MPRIIVPAAVLSLLITLSMPTHAEALGDNVNAPPSYSFPIGASFFDPTNNIAPIAAPHIDVDFDDTDFAIAASFTDTTLTLSDDSLPPGLKLLQFATFTDAPSTNDTLTLNPNSFTGTIPTGPLSDDTLSLSILTASLTADESLLTSNTPAQASNNVPLLLIASAALLTVALAFACHRKLIRRA